METPLDPPEPEAQKAEAEADHLDPRPAVIAFARAVHFNAPDAEPHRLNADQFARLSACFRV